MTNKGSTCRRGRPNCSARRARSERGKENLLSPSDASLNDKAQGVLDF